MIDEQLPDTAIPKENLHVGYSLLLRPFAWHGFRNINDIDQNPDGFDQLGDPHAKFQASIDLLRPFQPFQFCNEMLGIF